jgi:hypothetical protein
MRALHVQAQWRAAPMSAMKQASVSRGPFEGDGCSAFLQPMIFA